MSVVGFVGLGNMGRPMARNLRRADFEVVVFDVDTDVSAAFADEFGGTVAVGPADFAPAEIVVTMLPDGKVVADAILEADGGIASGLVAGAVVVDMSSSNPLDTRKLGDALAERGIGLVDAPVSGGIAGADSGELTLMVGGDDAAAIERVRPVLEVLGGRIVLTGPLGSGHAMKALNNFCGAASYAATAEALAIGQRFGLSAEVMLAVLNTSTGRSFNTEVVFAHEVVTGRYGTNFALPLLAKDVGIAASLAESSGLETPVVGLVAQRWAQARDALGPARDHSEAHKAWWDVVLTSPAAAGSAADGG
ncbi:MAG TPA: NAD(P)-dependent oxidoreductase [Solirubrobacteraceae bacterium]|jgi:3-hydroxyisobutyrate dehydrogenase|nr:NAD(P)-dependent oxidoreductase [Solirubrobacteraceae bacterium]